MSVAQDTPIKINSLLSNDLGTAVSLLSISQPSHGSAVLQGSTVVYTPAPGYLGDDEFTYQIIGPTAEFVSYPATVHITVKSVPAPTGGAITPSVSNADWRIIG